MGRFFGLPKLNCIALSSGVDILFSVSMDNVLELVMMKSREMDVKAISETEGVKRIVR